MKTRERFETELRGWLASHGFEEDVVEPVIERLKARNLLNDERAAEALIARRSGKRAVGIGKLRDELIANGAEEALAERITPTESEAAAAYDLLISKGKTQSRSRAGRFLAGRGFEEDAIEGALHRAFGNPEDIE